MVVEISALILWVLSVFSGALSVLVGVVAKLLWERVMTIEKQIEKMATKINALQVDIVKIEQINIRMSRIEASQQRMEDRANKSEVEAANIRSKYIEKIDRLEENVELILQKLDGK